MVTLEDIIEMSIEIGRERQSRDRWQDMLTEARELVELGYSGVQGADEGLVALARILRSPLSECERTLVWLDRQLAELVATFAANNPTTPY